MALRTWAALMVALLWLGAEAVPPPNLIDVDWDDQRHFLADIREEVVVDALARRSAPVYHLEWTLTAPTTLLARQEVRVINSSTDDWTELWFHLLPNVLGGELVVDELRVDGRRREAALRDEGRLLAVTLDEPLEVGSALVVALDYRLEVPTVGGRNYGILGFRRELLSLAHAYALLAVYGTEGWDVERQPRHGDLVHAETAFFHALVVAPDDLTLVPSGRIVAEDVAEGMRRSWIAAGPVRDFYLAAATDLEIVEALAGDVVVRGLAPPGSEAGMEEAVEHAVYALELFERLYGPYPYREMEIAVIVTSALGIEFPGVIALRAELLLPGREAELLESTVVHEVAHQWFYAAVGNDQVGEPWLDESVTQYLTMRYFLHRYGAEGYRDFRRGLQERWSQAENRAVPIGGPVAAYTPSEYGAIVYGLGPLVIEWLASRLGRRDFDAFLRDYSERFRFGLATGADFRELAEEHCGCDLEGIFAKWIRPPAASD